MSDLNKVLLIGRVTEAPFPADNADFTSFPMIANGDVVQVAVGGVDVKRCQANLTVGKLVYVEGKLQDGQVIASSVTFLTNKKEP